MLGFLWLSRCPATALLHCCSLPHLCSLSLSCCWVCPWLMCWVCPWLHNCKSHTGGLTVFMGTDRYQHETCLSLPTCFFLTGGYSSWFNAGNWMIHNCKDYRLSGVQHLPLITMCSSQCKQHHEQEQPVGSSIRSWWKQDSYCGTCIGSSQPAALERMPRVGCSSPFCWTLGRDLISLFSLSFCWTFFHQTNFIH